MVIYYLGTIKQIVIFFYNLMLGKRFGRRKESKFHDAPARITFVADDQQQIYAGLEHVQIEVKVVCSTGERAFVLRPDGLLFDVYYFQLDARPAR